VFQQETSSPLPRPIWTTDLQTFMHIVLHVVGHADSLSSPTSLPPHAATRFHTVSQHLQAYKTDEPPIPEDQAQLSASLWVPALTHREHNVLS